MRFAEQAAALVLSFTLTTIATAQPSATDADLQKEATDARKLSQSQNFVAALPLYEDLHQRVPQSLAYEEGLAMSLLGAADTRPAAEADPMLQRAKKLLLEAQAAGDNSNLVQVLLEKLSQPTINPPQRQRSPGADALASAEKAFSGGDLAGAVKLYSEAFAADPQLYEAPLYAGDAEFKQGHYPEASAWFAKAVAVAPDRETAYRYWGDNLLKQGNAGVARDKFIEAIIAEPYQRAPRIGLKQWADVNHMRLIPPPISLPARAVPAGKGKDGKDQININLNPSMLGNPASGAVLAYTMGSAVWQGERFHKEFPNETHYRHSLAEELDSIHTALSVLKEQKVPADKLDASWKTLLQLDSDGLLACWILLDRPDEGIAQDYTTFRAAHRDLLRAYIAKYDLHPA